MALDVPTRKQKHVADENGFIGTRGLPPLPSPEQRRKNMQEVLAKMDEWLAEDGDYDTETYEALLRGLKDNPLRFGQQ
jgi:hypothetical protein